MMPEVLPSPPMTRPTSSVRSETLAHLRWLLAGVAAVPTGACSRGDRAPPPPLVAPGDGDEAGSVPCPPEVVDAEGPGDGGIDAGASADARDARTAPPIAPTATAPRRGYVVVDPMPPPGWRERQVKPPPSSDATKGCNPPFTIDAQGNKVFKTKCL
jgi:hypothetical protein